MIAKILATILARPKVAAGGSLLAVVLLLGSCIQIRTNQRDNARKDADRNYGELLETRAMFAMRQGQWSTDSTRMAGRLGILEPAVEAYIRKAREDSVAHAARVKIQQQQIDELRDALNNRPVPTDSLATQLRF